MKKKRVAVFLSLISAFHCMQTKQLYGICWLSLIPDAQEVSDLSHMLCKARQGDELRLSKSIRLNSKYTVTLCG